MFTVRYLHQKSTSYSPLLSGVTFGAFGMPLFFEVGGRAGGEPFEVEFKVVIDSARKPLALDVKPMARAGVAFNILQSDKRRWKRTSRSCGLPNGAS